MSKFDDTAKMFFEEEFDPTTYINALYTGHDYTKASLTELTNISNNLTIHLNFLVDQLNREINEKIVHLNKIVHDQNLGNSTRMNYYMKLLENSIISLNNELLIPEFEQLTVINKLIDFKKVKQNMLNTLKILTFIKQNFSTLNIRNFENDLVKLYQSILGLQDQSEKIESLDNLISCSDVFKNLNQFSTVYRKNSNRFIADRDELKPE